MEKLHKQPSALSELIAQYSHTHDKALLGQIVNLVKETYEKTITKFTNKWVKGEHELEEYMFGSYVSKPHFRINLLDEASKVLPWKESLKHVSNALRKSGYNTLAEFVDDCPSFIDTYVVLVAILRMEEIASLWSRRLCHVADILDMYESSDSVEYPFAYDWYNDPEDYMEIIVGTDKWDLVDKWGSFDTIGDKFEAIKEEIEANAYKTFNPTILKSVKEGLSHLMTVMVTDVIISDNI